MKYFTPLLLALLTFSAEAQIDTEFWFGAPDLTMGTPSEIASNSRRDSSIFLVFTTFDQPTQIQIIQPANLSFAPIVITIPANSTDEVNLGAWLSQIETKPANTVVNTGLLIRANRPITAYYEIRTPNAGNADIFSLKGKNALGTKFYTPYQTIYRNNQSLNGAFYIPPPRSGFIVMATADNTSVEITPSIDILGHEAGVTFTVMLHRGQTYYCEAVDGVAGSQPAGSLIESDKPIVVTVKDDMIDMNPNNDGGADIAGDQLISEEYLGTTHIIVKGGVVDNADRVVVCGTVDGTELFVDGSDIPIIIDAGEQHLYAFAGDASFLESSEKVSVFHISGFGIQLAGAVIPPLNCTGSNQVGFVRGLNRPFYLTVTIRAGSEGGFLLNGDAGLVPASAFAEVPGSDGEYVFARVNLSTSVTVGAANLLTNFGDELFHMGITNGNNQQMCNYGFFSAFSFLNIGENSEVCIGDTIVLDAGPGKTSYIWSTGEETQAITVSQPGTYVVEVFSGTDCSATDTIQVSYYEPPIDLGPNDTICDGTSLTLQVEGNYIFNWNDGSSANNIEVTEPGFYWLEVSDFQQCVLRDSIYIGVSPRPDTPEVTGQLEYCIGESIALFMDDVDNAFFRYILPDGEIVSGQNLVIENAQLEQSGLYQGFYVVEGCETFTDSVNIVINPVPTVDLGDDQSECSDQSITLDPGNTDVAFLWQDGSTEPTFTASISGDYSLVVTNDVGCTASDTVSLEFRPMPMDPVISGDVSYCAGEIISLETQIQEDAIYNWTDPSGNELANVPTVTIENAQPINSGNYSVFIELDGCFSETATYNLTVNPNPEISLMTDSTVCTGSEILLAGPEGYTTYNWSNGESTQDIIVGAGTYELTVSDANGCEATAVSEIFEDNPVADFSINPDSIFSPNTLVNFENESELGAAPLVQWQWTFGTGANSNVPNPSYLYVGSGAFQVTLIVTDAFGCTSTITKNVVSRLNFAIPEGFSPNGDGKNDVFEITGLEGISNTVVQIFNRWGNIVFESNDYKPGNFWDGRDSPDGTYFYIVTPKDAETITGNVTLAR